MRAGSRYVFIDIDSQSDGRVALQRLSTLLIRKSHMFGGSLRNQCCVSPLICRAIGARLDACASAVRDMQLRQQVISVQFPTTNWLVPLYGFPVDANLNISVKLGDTLGMLIWRETINGILCCLAVILINDTYVANQYKWSSLIRIFYAKMYNSRIHHTKDVVDNSVTKLYTPLRNCNGVVATE